MAYVMRRRETSPDNRETLKVDKGSVTNTFVNPNHITFARQKHPTLHTPPIPLGKLDSRDNTDNDDSNIFKNIMKPGDQRPRIDSKPKFKILDDDEVLRASSHVDMSNDNSLIK